MQFEGRGLGLPEGQVGAHPKGPGLPEKEQVRSDVRGPESLSPRTAPAPLVVPALLPQIQCKARRAPPFPQTHAGVGVRTLGQYPRRLQRKEVAAPAPPWDVTADHTAGRSHHSGQEAGVCDVGAWSRATLATGVATTLARIDWAPLVIKLSGSKDHEEDNLRLSRCWLETNGGVGENTGLSSQSSKVLFPIGVSRAVWMCVGVSRVVGDMRV